MAAIVVTETFFDLPFPRPAVWLVLSRTDWLNRALGLPAVNYRTGPLAEGGSAVFASARVAGLKLSWREWPFEWLEPEFYVVRREFFSGPLCEAVGGLDFSELPGVGTRLRVHSRLTPRNPLGSWLARAVIATYKANPECKALVWLKHGIMTWGETARETYSAMIDLVSRAEEFAARRASKPLVVVMPAGISAALRAT